MTVKEFSDQFDIQYNSIATNSAPSLDLYEKSVYLTRAQLEIVKNHFDPQGNKYRDGFEDSPKRRSDFRELIRNYNSTSIVDSGLHGLSKDSQFFQIPNNVFLIIQEQAVSLDTRLCENLDLLNEPIEPIIPQVPVDAIEELDYNISDPEYVPGCPEDEEIINEDCNGPEPDPDPEIPDPDPEPEISELVEFKKSANGLTSLNVFYDEEYSYIITTKLPSNIEGYTSLEITDTLPSNIQINSTKVVVNGTENPILSSQVTVVGQTVTLLINDGQFNALAGKNIILTIGVEISKGTGLQDFVGGIIRNTAVATLNNTDVTNSNQVSVIPKEEDGTTRYKEVEIMLNLINSSGRRAGGYVAHPSLPGIIYFSQSGIQSLAFDLIDHDDEFYFQLNAPDGKVFNTDIQTIFTSPHVPIFENLTFDSNKISGSVSFNFDDIPTIESDPSRLDILLTVHLEDIDISGGGGVKDPIGGGDDGDDPDPNPDPIGGLSNKPTGGSMPPFVPLNSASLSDNRINPTIKDPKPPKDDYIQVERSKYNLFETLRGRPIFKVYPKRHDEYNRLIDNPFRKPDNKIVWRLDYGFSNVNSRLRTIELISKYNLFLYRLRYVKYPKPIILTDLDEAFPNQRLSIEGQNRKSPSELHRSIHSEILDRAVELALIDYKPDQSLGMKVQMNQRNE